MSLEVIPEKVVDALTEFWIRGLGDISYSIFCRLSRSTNLEVLNMEMDKFLPLDVSLGKSGLFPNLRRLECTFKKNNGLIDVLKNCAERGGLKQLRHVTAKTFAFWPWRGDPDALPYAISFLKLVQKSYVV